MNRYFTTRLNCPVCKSTNLRNIYSCSFISSPIKEFLEGFYLPQGKIEFEYLKEAQFILDKCGDCGLIFQKEIPNEFLMSKLYEEWIDPEKNFERNLNSNDLFYRSLYAQEVMVIIAFLKIVSSQLKMLDFGMGWGKWICMASAFGCNCYGVELSNSKSEYAKSRGIKVITYNEISDHNFDFINTDQVFEHIPEPFETLCHMKKSLKPKGVIRISVPDGQNIERRLKIEDWSAPIGSPNSLNPVSPLEHINCFNRESLIKMARLAGFEIVQMPILLQLSYATNWSTPKNILKNFIYPIYRNIFLKGTNLYFRKKKDHK